MPIPCPSRWALRTCSIWSKKMTTGLTTQGFEILRGVFLTPELEVLRQEADTVSKKSNKACSRHLWMRSECFRALSVSAPLTTLLPPDWIPVRGILFDKTRTSNWPVPWHQDRTIAVKAKQSITGYGPWSIKDGTCHVQPPLSLLEKMMTIRIHLDDTPKENGALRVIPGSHQIGLIPSNDINAYSHENEVICECEAGDVLLMSPMLLHASRRSENPARRRILHFEYASRDALHPKLEWLEAPSYETDPCWNRKMM